MEYIPYVENVPVINYMLRTEKLQIEINKKNKLKMT